MPLISSFMGLPDVFNGWNIIFAPSKRCFMDLTEIESMIQRNAQAIIKRHSDRVLRFSSLNEIGAFIYQSQLPVAPALPVPEPVVEDPGPSSNKRRKCSSELGNKQLRNCGKEILNMIQNTLCIKDEDATPYLLAALRESRSLRALDCIKRSIFGSAFQEDENAILLSISDDVRVKQSVSLLPKRNIIFADEKKDHVLRIRDVISTVIKELPDDHIIRSDYSISEVTKFVLEDHPVYSELVVGNIDRWQETRGKVNITPGRKIDKEFEAAVWGKMMICEYEKKTVRTLVNNDTIFL